MFMPLKLGSCIRLIVIYPGKHSCTGPPTFMPALSVPESSMVFAFWLWSLDLLTHATWTSLTPSMLQVHRPLYQVNSMAVTLCLAVKTSGSSTWSGRCHQSTVTWTISSLHYNPLPCALQPAPLSVEGSEQDQVFTPSLSLLRTVGGLRMALKVTLSRCTSPVSSTHWLHDIMKPWQFTGLVHVYNNEHVTVGLVWFLELLTILCIPTATLSLPIFYSTDKLVTVQCVTIRWIAIGHSNIL